MSAHLAGPPYQPYPSGTGMAYGEFYWNSAGGTERALSCPRRGIEAAGDARFPVEESQNSDLSPASSSSENFSHFTPDSAPSPQTESLSPQPVSKPQKNGKEREGGMKKAKIHTAFSKEQLQTLHQRFQSQKYLSPQQIRELAAVLGLTYKQVKTCWKHPSCGQPPSKLPNRAEPIRIHSQWWGESFGKGGATCSVQQTVGFIAQHKVDFYHGFPGTMEYSGTKTGDGYSFHHLGNRDLPFWPESQWMTLGNSLHLSGPQFPICYMGNFLPFAHPLPHHFACKPFGVGSVSLFV
uniref:Homeobox domain-containing protein n=1 Tax=Chrysemys picta bellii TaxID=8478 RepID=A0A8C3HE91_CHRPI